MTKPHINDTEIYKIFKRTHGAYKALSLACKFLKDVNND